MPKADCDISTNVQFQDESKLEDRSNTKLKKNMALFYQDKLTTDFRNTIQSKIRKLGIIQL